MMSRQKSNKDFQELEKILKKPLWNDKVPKGFINNVNGWGFSEQDIKDNNGKLLTLDIDFGTDCSLNCPNCFRRDNIISRDTKNSLTVDNMKNIILQAKNLGLKSVKFLGAGEPLEYKELIPFLDFLHANDVIPLIFTKGHIIAFDKWVKEIHGSYGINTGKQLVKKLKDCNTSILFGYNSCYQDTQNKIVGNERKFKDTELDYFSARNRALQILIEEDYNKFTSNEATKLAFAMNPVTKENIDEIYAIYELIRKRNIYPIVTPTMMSGRGGKEWKNSVPEIDELIYLYKKIYEFNIKFDIQESVGINSISPYAGGHVCNQTAVGLYITLDGTILSCPGGNQEEGKIDKSSIGNPNDDQLRVIWEESKNYNERKGKYNCNCIAKDGYSIPFGFYDIVIDQVNNNDNAFQKLINILEYKIMYDWYKDKINTAEDNKKFVGISIQVEGEQQDEDSPTRKCSKQDDANLTKKMINSFCFEVQKRNDDAVKACNKLDYYLKKRIKKEGEFQGFICRCHEGVSNILFRYPHNYDNKKIDLFVFIGHILFTGDDDATNSLLETDKIKRLTKSDIMLNESRFVIEHNNISNTQNTKYQTHNISLLNTDDFSQLKKKVQETMKNFLQKYIDELQYKNYDALINGVTINNIKISVESLQKELNLLYSITEKDKQNEVEDLLENIQHHINSCLFINIELLKKIKEWTDDGLKGMILTDDWIDRGKKLKLLDS